MATSDARELMEARRWAEALRVLQQIEAAGHASPRSLFDLGWCLMQLERLEEAVGYLARAAKEDPSHFFVQCGYGAVLCWLERYSEAELPLLRSVALRDTGDARVALAVALMNTDRVPEAEQVHREGLRLRPESRTRVDAFADFLEDLGRVEEAEEQSRRASRMPPRTKKSTEP